MACPLWNPVCTGRAVVDGVSATASGVATVADGANQGLDAIGKVMPFMPFILLVLIGWIIYRLLRFSSSAVVGAADAYTGGKASGAIEAIRPGKSPAVRRQTRSTTRRKAPVGVSSQRNRKQSTGKAVGFEAASSQRRKRNVGKGPQPMFHDGRIGVIERSDDKAGQPSLVTVCGPNPGSAHAMLGVRMRGHVWRAAGSSKCDLNVEHQHYKFRKA